MSVFPPELLNVPYAIRIDQIDADTFYVGRADPGSAESAAVWRIQRVSVSGTVTYVLWAEGDSEFDNVWDARATLSYS